MRAIEHPNKSFRCFAKNTFPCDDTNIRDSNFPRWRRNAGAEMRVMRCNSLTSRGLSMSARKISNLLGWVNAVAVLKMISMGSAASRKTM